MNGQPLNFSSLIEETKSVNELSNVMLTFDIDSYNSWKASQKNTYDKKSSGEFTKVVTSHDDYNGSHTNNPSSSHGNSPSSSHTNNAASEHRDKPARAHNNGPLTPHTNVDRYYGMPYPHQNSAARGHSNSPAGSHVNSPARSHSNSPARSHSNSPARSHSNTTPHINAGFDHYNYIPTQPIMYNLLDNDKIKDTFTVGWYSYDRNSKAGDKYYNDPKSTTIHYKVELRKIDGAKTKGWTFLKLNASRETSSTGTSTEDILFDYIKINTKNPFGNEWTPAEAEGTYELRITPFNPKRSGTEYIGTPQTIKFIVKQNTLPIISVTNAEGEFLNFTFGETGARLPNNSYKSYEDINKNHGVNEREGIYVAITMKDVDTSNYQKGVVRLEDSSGALITSKNIIWQNGSDKIQSNNKNVTGFAFIPKASYLDKGTITGARVEVEVGDYLDSSCSQTADTTKKVQDVISDSNATVMLFNISRAKPVISIVQPAGGIVQGVSYSVNINGGATGIPLRRYKYGWTQSTSFPADSALSDWYYTSSNISNKTISTTQSGTWYLHIKAENIAGNQSQASSFNNGTQVDSITPKTTGINNVVKTNNSVTLSWSKFSEYSQIEIQEIYAKLGLTFTGSVITSGFGKVRVYAQRYDGTQWLENSVDIDGNGVTESYKDYVGATYKDMESLVINNLLAGGKYRFQIEFFDATGNSAKGPWKEVILGLPQVTSLQRVDPNIGLGWSATDGRGFIKLRWSEVPAADKYNLYIHDGYTYRKIMSADSITWDSRVAKIYPTEAELRGYAPNSVTADIFKRGNPDLTGGQNLRDNPENLYKATAGTERDSSNKYKFKVTTENQYGESEFETAPEIEIELPKRTDTTDPTFELAQGEDGFVKKAADSRSAVITLVAVDTESGIEQIVMPDSTSREGTIIDSHIEAIQILPTSSVITKEIATKKQVTYTVTRNGAYKFTAIDNVGRTKTITINVEEIDTSLPKINIKMLDDKVSTQINFSKEDESEAYIKYGYAWDADVTVINNNIVPVIDIITPVNFTSGTRYLIIMLENAKAERMGYKYEVTITENAAMKEKKITVKRVETYENI